MKDDFQVISGEHLPSYLYPSSVPEATSLGGKEQDSFTDFTNSSKARKLLKILLILAYYEHSLGGGWPSDSSARQ